MGTLKSKAAFKIQGFQPLAAIDYPLVATVISLKITLLVFGGLSTQILLNQPLHSLGDWLQLWNRWDTPRYLSIASSGYQPVGEGRLNLAFYPLFPVLIRFCSRLIHHDLLSALLISGVGAIAAVLLFQQLLRLDYSSAMTNRALWFFLIFPTSYFLHIGYTESLFLALTFGCLLAARKQTWQVAGLLGALATMTRINGLVLIPTLAMEAWQQYRFKGKIQPQWLWIGLVPTGFLIYLGCNFWVTGNPLTFLIVQREFWHKASTWPWLSLQAKLAQTLAYGPAEQQMVGVQELLFIALGAGAMCWSWLKLRPAYSVWITGNWLLFTSTSFILSTPRYTLVLFPIFILFSKLAKNRFWLMLISVWSLMLLSLFTSLFAQGEWAF